MKKKISLLLIAIMVVISVMATASMSFAGTKNKAVTINATVAISGQLKLMNEKVAVTDLDNDGNITIRDAFIKINKDAGKIFSTQVGHDDWVGTFWSIEWAAVGYYLNNANPSTNMIFEPLKDGDNLDAFVYSDTMGWSDHYAYFDKRSANVKIGKELKLKLTEDFYGLDYSEVVQNCANANLVDQNGNLLGTTNEQGEAVLSFKKAGKYVIHAEASAEGTPLFPAVSVVTVEADNQITPVKEDSNDSPKTGDNGPIEALIGLMALSSLAIIGLKKKRTN